MTAPTIFTLIACRSCGKDIGADAASCPSCGAVNDWVHPKLAAIMTQLSGSELGCQVQARGHVLQAQAMYHNTRQSLGGLSMMLGMVCLPVGFFFPPAIGLAIFCICLGGALTGFGLSAGTRMELHLDLRQPGGVVGHCDRKFWAAALAVLDAKTPDIKAEKSASQ